MRYGGPALPNLEQQRRNRQALLPIVSTAPEVALMSVLCLSSRRLQETAVFRFPQY